MKSKEYIHEKENIHADAEAYEGEQSSGGSSTGEIVCTSKRVVFSNGKDVTDISLDSVNALEYSEKEYPGGFLIAGGTVMMLAIIGFLPLPIDIPIFIPLIAGLVGVLILLIGLNQKANTLKIHTPSKSFEFKSKENLEEIAQTIRGLEAR
jgi:hypothetical protein